MGVSHGFAMINTKTQEFDFTEGTPDFGADTITTFRGTCFSPSGDSLAAIIGVFTKVSTGPPKTGNRFEEPVPKEHLVVWDAKTLKQKYFHAIGLPSVVSRSVVFWGEDHILISRDHLAEGKSKPIGGQFAIVELATGRPVGELMGGGSVFRSNGVVCYQTSVAKGRGAAVLFVEFPETLSADASAWESGSLRRVWLTDSGVSTKPRENDPRKNLNPILKP